jgi:hypothetical protein
MSNKFNFQKLTPVSNADLSVYEDAINFVFENNDVKNVAISGAYSSGKSSILESYKAKHSDKRFVHLSLAHFHTQEQEELALINSSNDIVKDTVKESVIEGKILNQLIHRISTDKIPQTNFRIKKDVKPEKLFKLTAIISFFWGSIAFLVSYDRITDFVNAMPNNWVKSLVCVLTSQYAFILALFVCVVCAVMVTFFLIKAQTNKNIFRRISLQGNDIEIFEEAEDSYFDKYLNEVLYLFENVEADVIIFEDMDRLNASRIFERLREVNTLVNIHRKKEQKDKYSPLRFFYLLRDDIFISKDRTKFFDYIIPIVPIVDSSNSYEQFLKHLKEGELLDRFDHSFLQSLSLYIDDMRILKNIYNEFVVYFHRLNTTDLDYNKMLAIIAYKNLFPRDFSDLQLAKGFIHELFLEKVQLVEKELVSLNSEHHDLSVRIERAKNEILTAQQELDDAYDAKRLRLPKSYGYLDQNGQELSKQYDVEIEQRKQAIIDRSNINLSKLETELIDLEDKIILAKTKSLKDLITRNNIDSVFSFTYKNEIGTVNEFKVIKGSDYFALLKFLIRNGLIDETYTDYMTYFYDDSISANDKTFLRRITDKRGAEYAYALREPKKVIESPIIRKVEFEQLEILNFDLFECLLQTDAELKYSSYLETLIFQIQKTENFDFLSKYYDTGKARRQFVERINALWTGFICMALKHQVLPANQIKQFSVDTLYYSNEEVIKVVNADSCLTKFISNSIDYLAINNPKIQKLIDGFHLIGVRFVEIDYDSADKALFDEVYRRCLYELNYANITLMLNKQYHIESYADITHRNYTMILSLSDSPLAAYIADNISDYISIIIDNCECNINDNEDISINLLNNIQVDYTVKEQYIECLSTVISDISKIVDYTLWKALLKRGIVEFSVSNFVNYFVKYEIETELVDYLNSESEEVNFSSTASIFGEETATRLFDRISVCNEIDTEKYKNALLDLQHSFGAYEAENIDDDKFKVLIYEKILKMNEDSLVFVREKYSGLVFEYISQNLDEYLSFQTNEIFILHEALELLKWNIEDEKMIKLLALSNNHVSVVGKGYTDAVNSYLITHNLDAEEKTYLYKDFSEYGSQAQVAIITLAILGCNEIIEKEMRVDDALLSVLLMSQDVIRYQKIFLFTKAIPKLNEDTCKKHFEELGHPDLINIFTRGGGRRKYDKNEEVTMIFDALKKYNWIYDYREDENKCEKYYILKNIPKEKVIEFLD